VGKSSANATDLGIVANASGRLYATANGATSIFNRTTSDGDIVEFRKDNTTVGSIGSSSIGGLEITGNNSGRSLLLTTNFFPANGSGAKSNGVIDLGVSDARWKDLYLSSSIILKRAESAAVGTFGRNTDGTGRTLFEFRSESQNAVVGKITVNNSATAYVTSSDYRLKTDAQPMTGASDRVLALNPVNFEWISDGTRVDGFLAHEAQAVVPESVTGTKDAMMDEEYEVTPAVLDDDGNETTPAVMGTRNVPDYQGIDQSKLVPLLTAALREALTKINTMETRLTALEAV